MSITARCTCGEKIRVDSSLIGGSIICPECGKAVKIRASSAETGKGKGKTKRQAGKSATEARSLLLPAMIGAAALVLIASAGIGVLIWQSTALPADPALASRKLFERLATASPRQQQRTVNALLAIGEPAVPVLIEGLEGPDVRLRINSVLILTQLGPRAKTAVPALVKQLEGDMKSESIAALGAIGSEAKEAIGPLARLVHVPDMKTRLAAIESLGKIGALPADTVVELAAILTDPQQPAEIKKPIMSLLVKLGPHAQPAIPSLVSLLSVPGIMGDAAETLGLLGKDAISAYRDLAQANIRMGAFSGAEYNEQMKNWEKNNVTTTRSVRNSRGELVSSSTSGGGHDAQSELVAEQLNKKWAPVRSQFSVALARLKAAGAADNPAEVLGAQAAGASRQVWEAATKELPTGFYEKFFSEFPAWQLPNDIPVMAAAPLVDVLLPGRDGVPISIKEQAAPELSNGYFCRAGAALLLGKQEPAAKQVVPHLVEAVLMENNRNVVIAAAAALHQIMPGPMMTKLNPNSYYSVPAQRAFRNVEYTPVPAILEAYRVKDQLSPAAEEILLLIVRDTKLDIPAP